MKKNEVKMILVLILVSVIIIAVLVKMRDGKEPVSENGGSNGTVETENTDQTGEFVQVLEDGTKLNTSSKLSETKTFGNYEVSNIQLTEQNGQSLILADVKNIGATKADVVLIDITLLDKEGNEITTISGIIGEVEAGETVQLNASVTTDVANAYDFSIKVTQ